MKGNLGKNFLSESYFIKSCDYFNAHNWITLSSIMHFKHYNDLLQLFNQIGQSIMRVLPSANNIGSIAEEYHNWNYLKPYRGLKPQQKSKDST